MTKRFLEAAEKGVTVRKASLSCQDLVRHLSKSGPIILLTDASLLQCDICKVNKLTSELRGCLPWSTSFTGIHEHKMAASIISAAFDKYVLYYVETKCQLDATEVFIADLIARSTCFRHHCAHHQELKSIIQWLLPLVFRAVVFKLLVWCGAEGYVSGLQDAAARNTTGSNHCIILLSS